MCMEFCVYFLLIKYYSAFELNSKFIHTNSVFSVRKVLNKNIFFSFFLINNNIHNISNGDEKWSAVGFFCYRLGWFIYIQIWAEMRIKGLKCRKRIGNGITVHMHKMNELWNMATLLQPENIICQYIKKQKEREIESREIMGKL